MPLEAISILIDGYSLVNLNIDLGLLPFPDLFFITTRNIAKGLTLLANTGADYNTGTWATIHSAAGIPMSYLFN